jgi:hypothetical protein
MAEPEQQQPADALRAMAEGADARPDEPEAPEPADEPVWPPAEVAGGGDVVPGEIPEARPVPKGAPRPGGGFHKLMVPLLLSVGGLLLVLSALTLVKLLLPGGSGRGPLETYGWWLVLAACPLAAVLVLTAWLLHRGGRRATGGGA